MHTYHKLFIYARENVRNNVKTVYIAFPCISGTNVFMLHVLHPFLYFLISKQHFRYNEITFRFKKLHLVLTKSYFIKLNIINVCPKKCHGTLINYESSLRETKYFYVTRKYLFVEKKTTIHFDISKCYIFRSLI